MPRGSVRAEPTTAAAQAHTRRASALTPHNRQNATDAHGRARRRRGGLRRVARRSGTVPRTAAAWHGMCKCVGVVPGYLRSARAQRNALATLAIVLTLAGALVFLPCTVALILASWFALLTRPWVSRLAKRLGGRTRAAAVITTAVIIGFFGPIVLALVPVVLSAVQIASEVGRSQQWRDAAQAVVGNGADADIMTLVRGQVSNAWSIASTVLSTSASALFGVAMFVVSLYALSAHGDAVVSWLRSHSPLAPRHFDRLATVYAQTGRGLLIGVGATALIQGVLVTITYAIVGIPRALALGLLTTLCALIPGFGTVLIWGPVAVILAMGGYPGRAAVVAISGVVFVGSVDNFLKPIIAQRAHLGLPAVLVFITMLSGLVAFGPSGLVLGPLFVCLAREVLALAKEDDLVGRDDVVRPTAIGAGAPISRPLPDIAQVAPIDPQPVHP